MNSSPVESIAAAFKPRFDKAWKNGNIPNCNKIALEAAKPLLECDAELGRTIAWRDFFSRLTKHYRTQYQCFDFEVADYELHLLLKGSSMLRGPKPDQRDLERGRFVTFLGAAQLFGRYQRRAPHALVGDVIGMTCVNLSNGGAGPESFVREDVIDIANAGRAVVLQVLSGRSIGCEEYPGTRRTQRSPSDPAKLDRLVLLREIWEQSRPEAVRLVRKWQQRYVEFMADFIGRIRVPVILTWISERAADDWSVDRLQDASDFGTFPQLVDRAMVDDVARRCADLVEVSSDAGLPYEYVSRFTGETCPVFLPDGTLQWKNSYYPSAAAGAEISAKIAAALEALA